MEDFNSIFALLDLQYKLDIDEDDAIDIGLIAWNKIGNRKYRLYRYRGKVDPETGEVKLPCNCPEDGIEAVTYDFEDWQYTNNLRPRGDLESNFVEHYIEANKRFNDSFYMPGKYVKYDKGPGVIYVHERIPFVNILYKGQIVNDDGLPYLTPKEQEAIACYIAYTNKFTKGLVSNNQNTLQVAQLLEQRWLKLCDAARVTKLNQNDMNEILDAKSNWNRKIFGKSYKPIR